MSTTFERIESDVRCLPLTDQLRLMESLAANIRQRAETQNSELTAQLQAMALDPEMQQELCSIEADFAGTELDGLGVGA